MTRVYLTQDCTPRNVEIALQVKLINLHELCPGMWWQFSDDWRSSFASFSRCGKLRGRTTEVHHIV